MTHSVDNMCAQKEFHFKLALTVSTEISKVHKYKQNKQRMGEVV